MPFALDSNPKQGAKKVNGTVAVSMESEMELTEDLLVGAAAIARFINRSERATYAMIYAGQIPVIRKGTGKHKRIYGRKSELEAAFRSDAFASTNP